ncbi:hypothetical protein C8Q78DRAFT_1037583 [Trametes maxima]|nr:hypothetical protein C8Q78DRAFT_1037583 [Trametes maxima]
MVRPGGAVVLFTLICLAQAQLPHRFFRSPWRCMFPIHVCRLLDDMNYRSPYYSTQAEHSETFKFPQQEKQHCS